MYKFNRLAMFLSSVVVLASGCSSNNTLNSSWMSDNSHKIANKRLTQVVIPGTHFANAYGLVGNKNLQVCTGETMPTSLSGNAILAQKVNESATRYNQDFTNYLNTQTNNIYGQLSNGERYLELSICNQNATYYTSNYYLTDSFDDVIAQIKDFMKKNPDEIIILNFDNNLRDIYGYMMDSELDNFHNYLQMSFGSYLTPKQDWQSLTFKKMWDTKHRLIIFSSNPLLSRYYDVWDTNEVIGYTAPTKYAIIKKITAIQQSLPEINAAESAGKFSLIPFYSEFDVDYNSLSQLDSLGNDHLILDYLRTLTKQNKLNIIVSDRQYNRLTVDYAIDRNTQ